MTTTPILPASAGKIQRTGPPATVGYFGSDALERSPSFHHTAIHWRGVFGGYNFKIALGSISDGTSNTILMSERLIGVAPTMVKSGIGTDTSLATAPLRPSGCKATISPTNKSMYVGTTYNWSGRRWCSGIIQYTGFSTVLPPNGPSCNDSAWDERNTIITATSNHPGGVLGSMSDGSVRFFSETIDAGDPTRYETPLGAPSPYGVWGTLGTKTGGESVAQE